MNGRAHAVASLALALPLAFVSPVAAIGCACGVVLSPDLDQQGVSAAEWWVVRGTFGLGFVWLAVWWPYATIMPHRGASHWPVIGTLTRVLYLAGIVSGALYLAGPDWQLWGPWLAGYAPLWAAGLLVSDTAHWIMDGRRTR